MAVSLALPLFILAGALCLLGMPVVTPGEQLPTRGEQDGEEEHKPWGFWKMS